MTIEAAIKTRPISFSGPMVRAILDGYKTMTRRVMDPQPETEWMEWLIDVNAGGDSRYWIDGEPTMHIYTDREFKDSGECRYGKPGDRLYVKESWLPNHPYDHEKLFGPIYRADYANEPALNENGILQAFGWKSPRYMPKSASRLLLEITEIKVERVQEISERDAYLEGVRPIVQNIDECKSPQERFKDIWEGLYKGTEKDWQHNPWCWCIAFKVVK